MRSPPRFDDRTDAAERLGEALRTRDGDADVVLAIPWDGVPVGRAVADALGVPLDIVVLSELRTPLRTSAN